MHVCHLDYLLHMFCKKMMPLLFLILQKRQNKKIKNKKVMRAFWYFRRSRHSLWLRRTHGSFSLSRRAITKIASTRKRRVVDGRRPPPPPFYVTIFHVIVMPTFWYMQKKKKNFLLLALLVYNYNYYYLLVYVLWICCYDSIFTHMRIWYLILILLVANFHTRLFNLSWIIWY